ncbi:MAG: type II secretion system F family protein, partial [bacterium]|nr:type II secretion system F family protein [bacterium]
MPVYEYSALNKKGKNTKGTVDAENARAARQKLKGQGIYATEVKESLKVATGSVKDVKSYFKSERVSSSDLAVATRQLSTLAGAGFPIVDALQALSDQVQSLNLQRIVIDLRDKVQEGSSLAKALGNFPKAIPRLYVNMVASGEASGTLDSVFENLADYLEAQVELRRKVQSSLFYPALMLVFCTLVVTGLLAFVVPSIVDIFIKQGATLPLPTAIMLSISKIITNYWPLIIGVIVASIYSLKVYYRTEKGRSFFDRKILGLPILGSLYLKINTARMARTLGTLLSNGVGLLESMTIVKNIVNNVHLAKAMEDAREGEQEGRSLAKE